MSKHIIADADIPAVLGQRLRAAREEAWFSLEAAAGEVQLLPAQLEAFEKGQAVPQADELLRLAACYEASVAQWCEGFADMAAPDMSHHDLRQMIAKMLGDQEPSRGRSFRGLVKLLKGER